MRKLMRIIGANVVLGGWLMTGVGKQAQEYEVHWPSQSPLGEDGSWWLHRTAEKTSIWWVTIFQACWHQATWFGDRKKGSKFYLKESIHEIALWFTSVSGTQTHLRVCLVPACTCRYTQDTTQHNIHLSLPDGSERICVRWFKEGF